MKLWLCVVGVMVCGCVADVETVGVLDESAETVAAITGLPECQQACRNGQAAMEQFCRGLPPDPRLRTSCWMAAKVGGVFCLNWCYGYYGD